MTVAVVGCGIVGASCARRIAEAGHEAAVFEQFEPGHAQGSSHGGQKIVRRAYPDTFHTRLLVEAHPLWAELEAASGRKIVHECGLLYLGRDGEGALPAMCAALDEVGAPWRPSPEIPSPMRLAPGERAVLVPEAGWADTTAALEASWGLAERAGARLVRRKVGSLDELSAFDRVVVAAGAWAPRLAGLRARPTLQTSAYVEGRYEGPVWIEGFGAELYGFPNAPGDGAFKVGFHAEGPEADPEARGRPVDPRQLEALGELAERRFGIPASRLGRAFACIYTRTEGSWFQAGWADRRTLVLSVCSGHGYKFAPWAGRLAARMLDGLEDPPEEFALR